MIYHDLFTHSLDDGRLGYFQFGAVMNKAARHTLIIFWRTCVVIVFGICLGIEFLGHS